jgi:hypothetical protein
VGTRVGVVVVALFDPMITGSPACKLSLDTAVKLPSLNPTVT